MKNTWNGIATNFYAKLIVLYDVCCKIKTRIFARMIKIVVKFSEILQGNQICAYRFRFIRSSPAHMTHC